MIVFDAAWSAAGFRAEMRSYDRTTRRVRNVLLALVGLVAVATATLGVY